MKHTISPLYITDIKQMIMIIFIEKNKNIILTGNKPLEIIAEKTTFFKPGGSRANQAKSVLA